MYFSGKSSVSVDSIKPSGSSQLQSRLEPTSFLDEDGDDDLEINRRENFASDDDEEILQSSSEEDDNEDDESADDEDNAVYISEEMIEKEKSTASTVSKKRATGGKSAGEFVDEYRPAIKPVSSGSKKPKK